MASHASNNAIFCPQCGHENAPDAGICAQCDAPLPDVTTVAVSEVADLDVLQPLVQPLALNVDEVMFLISGKLDPTIVTLPPGIRQITIGRGVPGDTPPDLDLLGVGDTSTSVSRRHAQLDFTNERPTITDLESTNGTWVNENRLSPHESHPLRSGDLLRLGQQFIFVYFTGGPNTVEVVVLTDYEPSSAHLTPDLLGSSIGYLQTLVTIQDILSEAEGQVSTPVAIRDMNLRQAPHVIKVRLAGASAAIQLVTGILPAWRKQHLPDRQQANQNDDLSDELTQLIRISLGTLAVKWDDSRQQEVTQRLLPHIQKLALHTLELTIETGGG